MVDERGDACGETFRLAGLLFAASALTLSAAATLTQQIDPPEANVGDQVTVTFTVQNGGEIGFQLPRIDGLQPSGSSSTTNITFVNGTLSSAVSQTFALIPQRPGDFTIPSFDIHTRDGQVLHTQAMKLHVVGSGAPASANNSAPNPFGFSQRPGGDAALRAKTPRRRLKPKTKAATSSRRSRATAGRPRSS